MIAEYKMLLFTHLILLIMISNEAVGRFNQYKCELH